MVNINDLKSTKGVPTRENVFVTFGVDLNNNELNIFRVDRSEKEAQELVKTILECDGEKYKEVFYIKSLFV